MVGCQQCGVRTLVIVLCSSFNTYSVHCIKEAVKAREGIYSYSSRTFQVDTGGSENALFSYSSDSFRKKILKYFKVI